MPSLHRQSGRPYFFCAFIDQDGVRRFKSTKATKKKEAQIICNAWAEAARKAKLGPLTPDRARKIIESGVSDILEASGALLQRHTIKSYFDGWLRSRELESKAGTHERYKGIVENFLKFLGPLARGSLQNLTAEEIQDFRDELAAKVSSGTVNTYLKVLRVALNKAVKKNLIDRNPAASVDNLDRGDKHQRKPFTLEQVRKLLDLATDDLKDWRTMILNGYYTGLRLSDCANLTAADLDTAHAEYRLKEEKTERVRVVVIAAPLLEYLSKLPLTDGAPLCPSLAGKTESWLSNQFWELMAKAGIVATRTNHQGKGKGRDRRRKQSALTFHSLRHTATTALKRAGVSDVIARDIIGHESVAVSQNYTHIDEATKRAALEKMPDLLKGGVK